MRDSFKGSFALVALLTPCFKHDHCRYRLQAVLNPVCHLLQKHADMLARGGVLARKSCALRDIFDRQEDLLYLVPRTINLAGVEHHCAPADSRLFLLTECLQTPLSS